jgi:hypothetical protein
MAKTKNKNELTDLLDSIRKSLNNKTILTDKDIAKINDVVEIKKIKKELLEKIETASAFKHLETQKILEFFTKIAKDIKSEFENLEIEENRLAEENKKIREKNKKNTEKIENEIKDEEAEKNEAV